MSAMTETPQNLLQNLAEDEKSTPVMVYTPSGLSWGQLVTKNSILPERLLVGATLPDFITLYNAQFTAAHGNTLSKPIKYDELHIPYGGILGFHLMPPQKAQLDYDPSELNRIMAPITIHVGAFRFFASFRISTQATIKTILDVTKSDFIIVYDAEISHPGNPNMKPIQVNLALVNRTSVIFGETG
jgi:hypothetical protein